MSRKRGRPRRPVLHLTRARAARLYKLVQTLGSGARSRAQMLKTLSIGLRTFYREVELLSRVGVRIRFVKKQYELRTPLADVEARLPFPDPQLTFAEMKELSSGAGAAAQRLATIYNEVIQTAVAIEPRKRTPPRRK